MGSLNILYPGVTSSVSLRSDFDGVNPPTTPGFTGDVYGSPAWASDDTTLRKAIATALHQVAYSAVTEQTLPLTRHITFGFNENAEVFSLDGADPISFNSLPAGFTITALTLTITIGPPAANFVDCVTTVQIDGDDIVGSPDSSNALASFSFVFPDMPMSPTDFISTVLFIEFVTTFVTTGITFNFLITEFSLTGTFETIGYSWTIDNDSPVSIGESISISSYPSNPNTPPANYDPSLLDPPPLNLLDVDHLELHFLDDAGDPQTITIPISSFTSWTWYNITFPLPDFGGSSPPIFTIVYVDNGTQFEGSLPLGQLLTIFFVDGTGIYTLVPNKTNDTLYVQDLDPVQTVEVEIPTPFAKTGFLP